MADDRITPLYPDERPAPPTATIRPHEAETPAEQRVRLAGDLADLLIDWWRARRGA